MTERERINELLEKGETFRAFKVVRSEDRKSPIGYRTIDGKCLRIKYSDGRRVKPHAFDPDPNKECGAGIHVSTFCWARDFLCDEFEEIILEVEFNKADGVVVPMATRGKFRVGGVRVIREVPKSEWTRLTKRSRLLRAII